MLVVASTENCKKNRIYHRYGCKDNFINGKIVDYVIKHDAAKIIIQDDYRKLPKNTKKQKKYFRSAERKAKRKEMQRLDYLFAAIAQA